LPRIEKEKICKGVRLMYLRKGVKNRGRNGEERKKKEREDDVVAR